MQKFLSWILVIVGALHALLPVAPRGDKLNLDGYSLVFCDEFEGSELDTDVWYHRGVGSRRTGFNAESQVRVEDGKLILRGEYLTDGEYGEGWYTAAVALKAKYINGYFEICCKCNKDKDFWSAFWLQSTTSYDNEKSAGGVGGAEIDIFEAMETRYFPWKLNNAVKSTIYCNGTDALEDRIDRQRVGKYYVKNLYDEFHTFGLKWTEEEYISNNLFYHFLLFPIQTVLSLSRHIDLPFHSFHLHHTSHSDHIPLDYLQNLPERFL